VYSDIAVLKIANFSVQTLGNMKNPLSLLKNEARDDCTPSADKE